jgi:hypothetical protein
MDTTNAGPDACAAALEDALDSVLSPKPFDRLRRRNA